jgi:hypothetical protein
MEPDEMRAVAEFASLAPSVHNTQPWRFVATPHCLEVHIDPERGLHYLDPHGRQMYLSCGIVAEFARLAIRSLGSACTVRLLPKGAKDTLVAKLIVGSREPTTPAEQRLIDAVSRRYTDRGPYSDEPTSRSVLQRMRDAASERRCWLRVLDKPGDRLAAIRLVSAAEAAETTDEDYRRELDSWRRIGTSQDGIPGEAVVGWDNAYRVSDIPLRDFNGRDDQPRPGADEPPTVERDTIVVVGSDQDTPLHWLQAGRALADVMLVLTDADLVSQPIGPVLDLPGTRAQLRRELGLVGYPQLILRVGRGLRRPTAGRRSVDDTLAVAAAP